jgi:ubiquinone/menaquinone biosynthesis C-methylase UbiE
MGRRRRHTGEPADAHAFTSSFDAVYTRTARIYDVAVKLLPIWRRWLLQALPYLEGPRVLEVSFGTGWLLARYAGRCDAHGLDRNARMVAIARANLARVGLSARLVQGDVAALPYPDQTFDTVVSTMAFSGYPDAARALAEIRRVLRPDGRLVIIDVAHPHDGNQVGTALVRFWQWTGDVIRDLPDLLEDAGFRATDEEVGGWGSVHRYVADKVTPPAGSAT